MRFWRSRSRAEKTLLLLFVLTLPFIQPQVRDDGIGYYAYARSVLIDRNLQFKGDWKDLRESPILLQKDKTGRIVSMTHYTKTGHLADLYPVGSAILWAPFLVATHIGILIARDVGWEVAADGFSQPYLIAMALATAIYGFLALWLSFQLARDYFEERWAFLATLGIWFASSLPAYMYVDPAWSHAHSAFTAALFLWYWHRTRGYRTPREWIIFGLITGLMLGVYFANFVFFAAPLLESISAYRASTNRKDPQENGAQGTISIRRIFAEYLLYGFSAAVAFSPTLIARQIIFGNPLALGSYANKHWNWTSPAFWQVLFAPTHGLLVSTPILILAALGVFLLPKRAPEIGRAFIASALAFYLLISVYPWWDGLSSFGNRFFISLTPVFVVGLCAAFSASSRIWQDSRAAMMRVAAISALLILWNLGLVFQWSTGLLPSVGPIYWQEILYNEFRVVPGDLLHSLRTHFGGSREAVVNNRES